MIRNIYAGLLFALIVGIAFCCAIIIKKDRTPLAKSVRNLMTAAMVTIAAYLFAILVPNITAATAAYGAYFAAADVLLVSMIVYSRHFIGKSRTSKPWIIVLLALSLADAVMMTVNVFNGCVFRCAPVSMGSVEFYGIEQRFWLYEAHRVFIYLLATIVLLILGSKMFTSAKTYRYKYVAMLGTFVIIISVNVLSVSAHFRMDYSVVFYVLTAIAAFYFKLFYVPRELIQGIQHYVMKNMDDGVLCVDEEGKAVYANDASRRLFGVEPNGKLTKVTKYFEKWLDGRKVEEIGEISWKDKNGGRFYDIQFKPLYDNKHILIGCFFIQHDETEQLEKIRVERYRATHDRLTGLYNKEYFFERVTKLLSDKPNGTYCMVCSDIKDFKLLNDIFGVETGDEVLKKFADLLLKTAPEGSVYGRLSGDKFALCMPESVYDEDMLKRQIEEFSRFEGNAYHIKLQLGVYFITDNTLGPWIMCDRANIAIKSIKSSYKDSIGYYNDSLRDRIIDEQQITSAFPIAMKDNQFRIYIQAQVDATEKKVLGGEALVRWVHPERGVVPPMDFIPVFERTGLISELDRYVWELACKKLAEWKEEGRTNYHISVNISTKDLFFTDIYEVFTGLVEQYGIAPENLRLEITETAMMSDINKHMELVKRLQDYGFKVEMDDFGSGYSSLNMLKDIAVNTLKIDMAFLRQTENNERSRAILKAVIMMSKQLGIEVITEGVETLEQVELLTEFGSDVFQGYYFARPLPIEEFEDKYLYEDGI